MNDPVSEAQSMFEYTQAIRRDLHAHPELGFQEHRTAGIVAKELSDLKLEVQTGIGGTGVVAILKGSRPGPVILVRADMDALPIREETGASYASQNPGVMHACGHDGHTAILLTVARMLKAQNKELAGIVKFMFQPAEEGMGGAEKMITEGVLDNPKVDIALALHVWNEKPIGWFGISTGPAMAGAEIFTLKIHGKGGHAAIPDMTKDPILASAHVITAIQGIVARNVSPLQTAVISVCTINAGETFNVVPAFVEMTGTIRSFEPSIRSLILERFDKTVHSVAEALGCQADIDVRRLTPATINQPEIAEKVQGVARRLFPQAKVDPANYVTMGSEDFAFVLEKVPGCFIFVGSANPKKGLDAGHHSPRFDLDEAALTSGAALLTAAIMDILK